MFLGPSMDTCGVLQHFTFPNPFFELNPNLDLLELPRRIGDVGVK